MTVCKHYLSTAEKFKRFDLASWLLMFSWWDERRDKRIAVQFIQFHKITAWLWTSRNSHTQRLDSAQKRKSLTGCNKGGFFHKNAISIFSKTNKIRNELFQFSHLRQHNGRSLLLIFFLRSKKTVQMFPKIRMIIRKSSCDSAQKE